MSESAPLVTDPIRQLMKLGYDERGARGFLLKQGLYEAAGYSEEEGQRVREKIWDEHGRPRRPKRDAS